MGTVQSRSGRRAVAHALSLLGLVAIGVAPIIWYFSDPPQPPAVPAPAPAVALELPSEPPRRELLQAEAPAPSARCALEPIVQAAGPRDGHARAEHPFPGGPRTKFKVLVRAGERAAADQRPRDAEAALIAACEQAERVSPSPSVLLARVLGRLGDHYTTVAARVEDPLLRSSLVDRARQVHMRSVDVYSVTLGPNAVTTRRARQKLLALDESPVAQDAGDGAVMARPAAPRTRDARVPAASPNVLAQPQPQPRTQARAESAPRTQPAGGEPGYEDVPEFRQLASDLARLRSQAEAVSDDPAGLRMRTEAARARKDLCQDAACLRDWYASRRRELLGEF
jgi:hypothetical protein